MKHCKKTSENLVFGVNIVFHVLILFIFLTLFFILFVSNLTKKSFENEIGHLIDENLGRYIDNMDKTQKDQLGLYMNMIPIDKLMDKFKEPSEYVLEHNKWVKIVAIGVAVMGMIGLGVVIYVLYNNCNQCLPLSHIIKENVFVFALVGVVEYLFFVNVAFKFVPAPPSLLVKSLINKFKTTLEENTKESNK